MIVRILAMLRWGPRPCYLEEQVAFWGELNLEWMRSLPRTPTQYYPKQDTDNWQTLALAHGRWRRQIPIAQPAGTASNDECGLLALAKMVQLTYSPCRPSTPNQSRPRQKTRLARSLNGATQSFFLFLPARASDLDTCVVPTEDWYGLFQEKRALLGNAFSSLKTLQHPFLVSQNCRGWLLERSY
jgi:hypothetical protein